MTAPRLELDPFREKGAWRCRCCTGYHGKGSEDGFKGTITPRPADGICKTCRPFITSLKAERAVTAGAVKVALEHLEQLAVDVEYWKGAIKALQAAAPARGAGQEGG